MAIPTLVQSNFYGGTFTQIGPIDVAFPHPLTSGNTIFGYHSFSFNPSILITPWSDTQGNTWSAVDFPPNTDGHQSYGYGTTTAQSGADTVSVGWMDNFTATYNPSFCILEIANATSHSTNLTMGNGTPISGSITTPTGQVATFTSSASFSNWSCNMVCFSSSAGSFVVAIPYALTFGEDVPGWTGLYKGGASSSIYIQSVLKYVSPVRVFVNTGPTKPVSSI